MIDKDIRAELDEIKIRLQCLEDAKIPAIDEKEIEELLHGESEEVEVNAVEWKRGDECTYEDEDFLYVATHPSKCLDIIYNKKRGLFELAFGLIEKPESPEQREAREREDGLRSIAIEVLGCQWDFVHHSDKNIVAKMYDAGYRKQ